MSRNYTIKFFFSIFISLLGGIDIAWSQTAPQITYTSPQNYTVNTPIAPLVPNNSGGLVPATNYGQVTTLAGSGVRGYNNNTGTSAQFDIPEAIVGDAAGNLYVADYNNNAIRKITPAGVVTTFAGSLTATPGNMDGVGTAALFNGPDGIAIDGSGNLFVADYGNNAIRKIAPDGTVSTFATNIPTAYGLCFDSAGNLIVAEYSGTEQIVKISPAGVVTPVAGSFYGYINSTTPTSAAFAFPEDVQVDAAGNIYVADYLNNAVRMISTSGAVTTFAGSNVANNIGGWADGVGTAAKFNNLTGLAMGNGNVLYVADLLNDDIRRILPDGTVTTVAGNQTDGAADGIGTAATFFHPVDLYIDNSGIGYVADARNGNIRKIVLTGYTIDKPLPAGLTFDPTTGIITGTPVSIMAPTTYTITGYNGAGFSQSTVTITVRPALLPTPPPPQFTYTTPNVYTVNTPITPLTPNNTGGAVPATIFGSVTTLAGQHSTAGYADATGQNALFTSLWGIDMDASGNLYVADNTRIRKITPAGVVTTVAGGNPNNLSDGTGTAAGFGLTAGLNVNPSGNILVGDINNKSVRQVTPGGVVTTVLGTGVNNFDPAGVTTDPFGDVFVADQINDVIREFPTSGAASIYSGNPNVTGSTNGPATSATFNNPADLKFDQLGNLFIADEKNNMIREINVSGTASTVAGKLNAGLLNGSVTNALFNNPIALALDAPGNIYVSDWGGVVIRMIDTHGTVVTVAGDDARKISADGIGALANFYHVAGLVYNNGVLYAADKTCVRKILVTGYTIDKPLPIGLTFDSATGTISGTPTVASPATDYVITGYNTGGSYSTTVNISVVVLPPAITYPTPQVYITNVPIAPLSPTNAGGDVSTGYTVNQPLPAGLTLDPNTGVISGTPTTDSPATDYQITAGNAGGTSTFTINITVKTVALPMETITFGPLPAKTYGDQDFAPGAQSNYTGMPITYTSDNPNVATIVNGQIHIVGAGTANITASQTGDNNYSSATPVTQQLSVDKALLNVKANDQSRYFGQPNPPFSLTYTGFVNGDTPASLTVKPVAGTTAVESSPAGDYAITVTGGVSSNYYIFTFPGTLTILPVPPAVVIPNAFTPNGDGYNDLWNIQSIDAYPQSVVSVYSRYGSLIFQSKGYSIPWDGTRNGSPVPVGTYYYIIDPRNGTKPLSGYVAVIR